MSGSFNNYARKVRDPQQPFGRRYSGLISCIRLLGDLTGNKFRQTYSRYAALLGPEGARPSEDAQLLAALAAMERDRNIYLAALRAFERRRIRQKMRGQRHPRKADKEVLSAAFAPVDNKTNNETNQE